MQELELILASSVVAINTSLSTWYYELPCLNEPRWSSYGTEISNREDKGRFYPAKVHSKCRKELFGVRIRREKTNDPIETKFEFCGMTDFPPMGLGPCPRSMFPAKPYRV